MGKQFIQAWCQPSHLRFMRRAIAAALLLATGFVAPARSQGPFPTFVMPGQDVRSNSPGLQCRQTDGYFPAYDAPSPGARVLRTMAAAIAVTGPARNGFLPVLMGNGQPAWMKELNFIPVSRFKTCFIQRTREGSLRWTVFNSIQ